MKTFKYENLKAVELISGVVEIEGSHGEVLATIEPLKRDTYGNPRYEVTDYTFYGMSRLAKTYRQVKNSQFVQWWGNLDSLTDTVMLALLDK
mgnify:CR=1 FL=1